MRNSIAAFFILLVSAGAGCHPAPANTVVLQVGDYTLSEDALQALRQQGAYRELTDPALADRLVQEARILAYAGRNRFDTIVALQQQLAYAMRYQVSSVNGYLWNRQVKPTLQVSTDELKKAHALRAQECLLEYLFIPGDHALLPDNKDLPDRGDGEKTYAALRSKVAAIPGAQVFSGWRTFPFVPLAVYLPALATPAVGSLYGPVPTLHGTCIVYVKAQRRAALRTFTEDSAAIHSELLLALQEDKIWRSQEQVMNTTRPVFHDSAIHSVAMSFRPADRSWPGVDTALVLMEYAWQGQRQRFSLTDLQELMRYQPVFMGSPGQAGDVKKMLSSYLIGLCLYEQARALGMEQDPAFQLQQQHFLRGLYIQHYKQAFVYPRLVVQDTAIEAAYRRQPAQPCFDKATVDLYSFPDLPSAMAGRQSLVEKASPPGGAVNATPGKGTVPRATTAGLLITTTDTLCGISLFGVVNRLSPGEWSMPVLENGQYVVVHLLNRHGMVPMPFKYAAADLRQALMLAQEHSILQELEQLFPVRINRLKDLLVLNGR